MKKLKHFFKKNTFDILSILAAIPLLLVITFSLYQFFFRGGIKSILYQLNSFWGGVIITILLTVFLENFNKRKK